MQISSDRMCVINLFPNAFIFTLPKCIMLLPYAGSGVDLALIWYLVSIHLHFCMVSPTLTSPNFIVFRIDLPAWWQSHLHLLSVQLLRSFHWLPVKFRSLFKITLLTYKTLREKLPVYLHSMFAASLPSHSLYSDKGISLSVPSVKTSTGARAFHSCAPFLGKYLPLSVHSAISVATFKKHFKTHLFDSALPP